MGSEADIFFVIERLKNEQSVKFMREKELAISHLEQSLRCLDFCTKEKREEQNGERKETG